jgi:hypothetical protein
VAITRHPLRGFTKFFATRSSRVRGLTLSTGSRTHPWLYPVTRFAGSLVRFGARSLQFALNDGYIPVTHPWLYPSHRPETLVPYISFVVLDFVSIKQGPEFILE